MTESDFWPHLEHRVTLLLAPHVRTPDQIDWPTLLPPEDVTGWLSMDVDRRHMKINPLAAYPDPVPPDE